MLRKLIAMAGVAVALVGCGGGGGGSTSSFGGVTTFFTDSMDGNDHVWVKVYSVELLKASGPVQVYLNADGKEIDLKTLRDDSGARFAFISDTAIPHESYTGVRVKMDKALVEFPSGASTGLDKQFSNAFDDGAGKTVVTFNFPSPKQFSPGDSVVVDFDLANWNDTPEGVVPVLKEGTQSGIDDVERHEDQAYHGVVQNLHGEAPDNGFTLSGDGTSYTVEMSGDTAILNSDGSPNPSLANGKEVEVRGVWSADRHVLLASRVSIRPSNSDDEPASIEGPTSEYSADSGWFVMSIKEAHGFMPKSATMLVSVGEGTQYFSDGGAVITKEMFFAAIVNGRSAEAWGVVGNPSFTATRVKLEKLSDSEGTHTVHYEGTINEKNVINGTLNLSPTSWEGVTWTSDKHVGMLVGADTHFRDGSGETVTKAAFYELISVGSAVDVHGYFSGTGFLVTDIRIVPQQ